MDFELIKKILEKEKSKIIIFEDGKPTMVISPVEEYLKQENPTNNPSNFKEEKISKNVNQETSSEEETIFLPEESGQEKKRGLTIDDLPL